MRHLLEQESLVIISGHLKEYRRGVQDGQETTRVMLFAPKVWRYSETELPTYLGRLDHLWISTGTEVSRQMLGVLHAIGSVYCYEREDGTRDYGINPMKSQNLILVQKWFLEASKSHNLERVDGFVKEIHEVMNDHYLPISTMDTRFDKNTPEEIREYFKSAANVLQKRTSRVIRKKANSNPLGLKSSSRVAIGF